MKLCQAITRASSVVSLVHTLGSNFQINTFQAQISKHIQYLKSIPNSNFKRRSFQQLTTLLMEVDEMSLEK